MALAMVGAQAWGNCGPEQLARRPEGHLPGSVFVRPGNKSVYLGRFGGRHLAYEDDNQIVALSNETVAANLLNPGAMNFPMILKQPTFDSSVPEALAYIGEIVPRPRIIPVPFGSVWLLPLSSSWLSPAGFLRDPLNPVRGRTIVQNELIRATLVNSGYQIQETDESDQILEALSAGKKVFLSLLAIEASYVVIDEAGGRTPLPALVPWAGGDKVHAMVGLSVFKSARGEEHLLLADPSSGFVVPVKVQDQVMNAVLNAFIFEN
jgi:hypothetical protein